jgi:regulator of protease activity HflC (stomatin/prohibitin superfamily)
MLNIGYFKGQPTDYILKFSGGRLRKEGKGLAFFYWKHATQVVAVPTSSMDASFVFAELTKTFQEVTIQGQATYVIHEPKRAAELLNFTLDPTRRSFVSTDPDRLPQRITNVVQTATRAELQDRSLEEVLGQYESIASTVLQRVKGGQLLSAMGVELLSVFFTSARPTPEVAKALEAEYRETLLRKADEAIFARRAAAVEEERKIKEKELSTDITLEQQRRKLIDLQGENALIEAENQGKALELAGEYKARAKQAEIDIYAKLEPRSVLALAMTELGQNADHIGNLTITSEMLASLLNGQGGNRE